MILFTGDLYLGKYSNISQEVIRVFDDPAYIITNFENVLEDSSLPKRKDKDAILTYADSNLDHYLETLSTKHIFGLGNNHIHDLNEEGIENTIENLNKKMNVFYAGVGTYPDLLKPLIIREGEKELALLFISSDDLEVASIAGSEKNLGILDWQHPELLNKIREIKRKVEKVILVMHVGKEYLRIPSIYTRKKAYSFIDAGADLVIGHHPHVIQGKEKYNGKWIYYSLGNYIFPNFVTKKKKAVIWQPENNYSIALNIDFSNEIHVENIGLFFDSKKNILSTDDNALTMLEERSKFFEYPLKKYFGLWENELYRVLKSGRGVSAYINRKFPKHINHGRLSYLVIRVLNKIQSKWISRT